MPNNNISANMRSCILRIYHHSFQIIFISHLLSDPQKLGLCFAMIAQINRWGWKKSRNTNGVETALGFWTASEGDVVVVFFSCLTNKFPVTQTLMWFHFQPLSDMLYFVLFLLESKATFRDFFFISDKWMISDWYLKSIFNWWYEGKIHVKHKDVGIPLF